MDLGVDRHLKKGPTVDLGGFKGHDCRVHNAVDLVATPEPGGDPSAPHGVVLDPSYMVEAGVTVENLIF